MGLQFSLSDVSNTSANHPRFDGTPLKQRGTCIPGGTRWVFQRVLKRLTESKYFNTFTLFIFVLYTKDGHSQEDSARRLHRLEITRISIFVVF